MKPALTEQEWMIVKLRAANKPIGGKVRGYVSDDWSEEIRHAVAAQSLYGQPFGFTREDVKFMRTIAEFWEANDITSKEAADRLRSVADRIEALLPPEG